MDLAKLLSIMHDRKGSDLFVSAGSPLSMKIDGKVKRLTKDILTYETASTLVLGAMNQDQRNEFEVAKGVDFGISIESLGRFRVSAFIQRNAPGMVIRRINSEIPTLSSLGLPPVLETIAAQKKGLVLFVGGTGSGKSTSMAAMIDHHNKCMESHILTIEDPIEFEHQNHLSLITQREVGVDVPSFDDALKSALRQAPDVILMGEIRSAELMHHAIQFAETGHLCIATLHANNANQAIDRILSFFPSDRHSQVKMDLSLNLKAIIAQQLIQRSDQMGRCVAVEILLDSPVVKDLIRKGDIPEIKEVMKKSNEIGMQTFDQSLFHLFNQGAITQEVALRHADSPNDLNLMIKLNDPRGGSNSDDMLTESHNDAGNDEQMSISLSDDPDESISGFKVKLDGFTLCEDFQS